jgi:protein gp37
MGEVTGVEWADHTFNPWWGCSRVSPACRFCYADRDASRWYPGLWLRHGPRRMMSESTWQLPYRWNRAAAAVRETRRVFCASMADVFEDHPQVVEARARLWQVIGDTPWLVWMLLTKRPENVAGMVPWPAGGWPRNVWLGVSAETQRWLEVRVPALLTAGGGGAGAGPPVRFVSCEPLLGHLDLRPWLTSPLRTGVDWVITGGESGRQAGVRMSHPDWFAGVRDQAQAAEVPLFHKQNGEWSAAAGLARPEDVWLSPDGDRSPWAATDPLVRWSGGPWRLAGQPGTVLMRRVGKRAAGRQLAGRIWEQFPG